MNEETIKESIKELRREVSEMRELVEPIAQTYQVASTMGRWFKGFLVFAAVSISVITGMKEIIKK